LPNWRGVEPTSGEASTLVGDDGCRLGGSEPPAGDSFVVSRIWGFVARGDRPSALTASDDRALLLLQLQSDCL